MKESWEIYKSKFVVFVLIMLFISLPGLFNSYTRLFDINNLKIFDIVVIFIIPMIFSTWGQAAMIYATRDKNVNFSDSLKLGLSKLVPIFLLMMLTVLIVVGGFILLIIPGIIFMVWFAFSQFALINENLGVIKSLKRSRELVRGKWWDVFGRLLFLLLISILFEIPSAILGRLDPGITGGILVNTATSAVITPLMTIYMFLLYTNLKGSKS